MILEDNQAIQLRNLLEKYHHPLPRYSYFPTLKHWKEAEPQPKNKDDWRNVITSCLGNLSGQPTIDLYIHIPFCEQLCTFCGCNIVVTRDHQLANPYLEDIKKEFQFYFSMFPEIKIKTIYLGGGTPNFLSASELTSLFSFFKEAFHGSSISFGTIEIDPRYMEEEKIEVCQKYGINNFSIGVQDFNLEVLKNVNRNQPFELLEQTILRIKQLKQSYISIDLIYGLPGQTVKSIQESFKKINDLQVDAVNLYPLAMATWIKGHQQAYSNFKMANPKELADLHLTAHQVLISAGFSAVGMGYYHRSPPAHLRRNITGFTSDKSSSLLGLGVGAISLFPGLAWQNQRILEQYRQQIQNEKGMPIKFHVTTNEEARFEHIFETLICNKFITLENWRFIESFFKINPASWDMRLSKLTEMKSEGLIILNFNNHKPLEVTPSGILFLKNICGLLDPNNEQTSN